MCTQMNDFFDSSILFNAVDANRRKRKKKKIKKAKKQKNIKQIRIYNESCKQVTLTLTQTFTHLTQN